MRDEIASLEHLLCAVYGCVELRGAPGACKPCSLHDVLVRPVGRSHLGRSASRRRGNIWSGVAAEEGLLRDTVVPGVRDSSHRGDWVHRGACGRSVLLPSFVARTCDVTRERLHRSWTHSGARSAGCSTGPILCANEATQNWTS